MFARDLDGVLDGLGAGVREDRLLREVAGRQRVEPLGELDVGLVRRDVEAACGYRAPAWPASPRRLGCGVADVLTPMPVAKSMRRLPSTSSMIAPDARAVTTGWIPPTPRGTADARRTNHSLHFGPGTPVTSFRSCGMSMTGPPSPASSGASRAALPASIVRVRAGVSAGRAVGPGDGARTRKHAARREARHLVDAWRPRLDRRLPRLLGRRVGLHVGGRARAGIRGHEGVGRARVVVERFESLEPEQWSGMSLSVFDEVHGWRQTWADSTGNYWALEDRPMPRASPSP